MQLISKITENNHLQGKICRGEKIFQKKNFIESIMASDKVPNVGHQNGTQKYDFFFLSGLTPVQMVPIIIISEYIIQTDKKTMPGNIVEGQHQNPSYLDQKKGQ